MSDLTAMEKRKLERALEMGTGYVLDFSNRTFAEFFRDNFGLDIYDSKYDRESGSKAHRMRAFWDKGSNHDVGRVLELLFDEWREFAGPSAPSEPPVECLKILHRLKQSPPVDAIDAITPEGLERGFEDLAKAVRDSIEKNKPGEGLDRLHTFVTKLIRTLADKRGVDTDKRKPLHSVFAEYVKRLRDAELIESEMTKRILKSSIGTLEAFNDIRNNSSYAHDNILLNYEEALLVCSHVCSTIRFIRAIESRSGIEIRPEHVDSMMANEAPF